MAEPAYKDEEFDYPVPTIDDLLESQRKYLSYSETDRERYINAVIEAITNSDKGLHYISRQLKQVDSNFPPVTTILRWIGASKEKTERYAHAKASQMDLMVEDLVHIADTELDPNRARVRIDARKWVASKLAPKKYGERLEVNHAGNLNLSAMSDQELMRIVQEQTGGPILIGDKDDGGN